MHRMDVMCLQDGCDVSTGWMWCVYRMDVMCLQDGYGVSTGWMWCVYRKVVCGVEGSV